MVLPVSKGIWINIKDENHKIRKLKLQICLYFAKFQSHFKILNSIILTPYGVKITLLLRSHKLKRLF